MTQTAQAIDTWIKIERIEDVPQDTELLLFDEANKRRVIGIYKFLDLIGVMGWYIENDFAFFNSKDAEALRNFQQSISISRYALLPEMPKD